MTREEARAIIIISHCRYYPASRDKYWMKNLRARFDCRPHEPLTEFQKKKLWYLVHRYRRQHGRCTCLECLKASRPKNFNPYQGELFDERTVR